MKRLETYVKLLGKMDHRMEAWKTSRPGTAEVDIADIQDIDFSLNGMCVYTFEMRSSVFFRDLIFSMRPLNAWAMSIRALPVTPDNVCLSSEYKDSMGQDGINEFFTLLAAGVPRDSARDVLPLSVSTTYTFTMDHRVLISFCKNIERLNPRLFSHYCNPMLGQAGITERAFNSSKIDDSLNYCRIQEPELLFGTKEAGNMIVGHYPMKCAMASQFLRQHYSRIKTSLWNIVYDYFDINITQSDKIDMVFYIDQNAYHKLMTMRSHWVLDWHMDMWGTMLDDYTKDMSTEDFWFFLPSGNNQTDPYIADGKNRVALTDPGLPCPIMTEWPGAIHERRKELGDNPILNKYEDLFKEGLVKDNPDNEYRIQYFNNLRNK